MVKEYKGQKYPYMDKTYDGLKILEKGMDKHGMLIIIADRGPRYGIDRYVVGVHYSPRTGYWGHGHYFDTLREAFDDWHEQCKYTHFDENSEKDLEFERMGRFNYNHTSAGYLKENDYRQPDFDIYANSHYEEYFVKHHGEKPGRKGFSEFISRYVVNNPNRKRKQNGRSAKKGGFFRLRKR